MGNAYRRDHMPTQDFLHEGMCVREGVLVFEIGKAVESNYGVELYLRSFLYFRVQRHGQKERRGRRNGLAEFNLKLDHGMGRYLLGDTPCQHRLPTISVPKVE